MTLRKLAWQFFRLRHTKNNLHLLICKEEWIRPVLRRHFWHCSNTYTINTYKQLQAIFLCHESILFHSFFQILSLQVWDVIAILMQDVDTVLVSKKPNLSSHCFSINNCNAHARSSNWIHHLHQISRIQVWQKCLDAHTHSCPCNSPCRQGWCLPHAYHRQPIHSNGIYTYISYMYGMW